MGLKSELAGSVRDIQERIARACARAGRDPAGVRLVAVTKGRSLEELKALWELGVTDFGENRVQELTRKAAALAGEGVAPAWHMIGYLQRNKVKALLDWCRIIHSLDRLELGEAVSARAQGGPPVKTLVEVNITGEATKSGVGPEEALALVRRLARLPGLVVSGLMTMAPAGAGEDECRRVFGSLRQLRDRLAGEEGAGASLAELSMGMSQDFEAAVMEGATLVRVGRALFQPRG
ncbi:MAG: YggS family pyridoxal phosphate-dependent enzyme [Chitinophagales bacterium]